MTSPHHSNKVQFFVNLVEMANKHHTHYQMASSKFKPSNRCSNVVEIDKTINNRELQLKM